MPSIARLSDVCSGHGCFPSRANTQGSPNVFINGRRAHRVSDSWGAHTCSGNTHSGSLASGSSSVFVNGRRLGRVGDFVSCGSLVATGSPNVFAGD